MASMASLTHCWGQEDEHFTDGRRTKYPRDIDRIREDEYPMLKGKHNRGDREE